MIKLTDFYTCNLVHVQLWEGRVTVRLNVEPRDKESSASPKALSLARADKPKVLDADHHA